MSGSLTTQPFTPTATEVEKARKTGRKALATISFREPREKFNVGIAMLSIECRFGTKMTDLGAEAALDAEHGDPHVEFLSWLAETYRRQGLPPGLARFFNLGSLPEEKKVTKTPVKKREYKPRYSPKIEALRKKANEHKSKYKESNKKLQAERMMERATNILNRIEKHKHILENVLASMEKKNIQMDKNGKERVAATSREIEKIKNNINHMNELVKFNKNAIARETKTWKNKEAQAKTDMEESIEELNNTKEQMKERIKAMKQHMAAEKDRIDREIENIKDKQVKKESNINKNIEAKKNTLSTIRDQFEKNIQAMQQREAEQKMEIEAEIEKLKEAAAQAKTKMERNIESSIRKIKSVMKDNIEALQNSVAKTEEEFEKDIKALRLQEEEIKAKHKKNNEIKAQKKENIENIEALHKKFSLNKEGVSIVGTSSGLYTHELPRNLHFSRPSTSSDIGTIDLTDEETDLPSNSANDAASLLAAIPF